MRNRSFIGLIFLVMILMIASIPALLEPTSNGIETVLVKAGALPDTEAKAKKDAAEDAKSAGDPPESRLLLKGHELTKDGDLRDTYTTTVRSSNQHGRLVEGDTRVGMPGEQTNQDAYSRPLVTADGGMILDSTGCPVFDPETNVDLLFQNADTKQTYVNKAGSADDPTACLAALDARAAADAKIPTALLPGDRRQAAASVRSDSDRMLIDLYRIGVWDTFFGSPDTSQYAADIKASLASG